MQNLNYFNSKSLLVALATLLLFLTGQGSCNELLGVRWNEGPNNTRIVIDLKDRADFKYGSLDNPPRVYVDLKNTTLERVLSLAAINSKVLKKVRHARRDQHTYRVVFDLHEAIVPQVFRLSPHPPYGHRLVVDFSRPIEFEDCTTDTEPLSDVVIVVDAGHGGEDPGALGHNRLLEKNVNLVVAKTVRDTIESQDGFKVVMTRDGDYEVPLVTRRDIGLRERAHLFVSIHADSFTSPRPRGASVFVLATGRAQRELDRWQASNEQREEWTGGVASWVNSQCFDDPRHYSFLNTLATDAVLENSVAIGKSVLSHMSSVARLHPRALAKTKSDVRVTDAEYKVLQSTHVPSILIETGFLSNPQEAALLAKPSHQKDLGRTIAAGILAHFCDNPPWHTDLSLGKVQCDHSYTVLQYTVQQGDTLSEIALAHNVKIASLRQVNNLINSELIHSGQILTIPSRTSKN